MHYLHQKKKKTGQSDKLLRTIEFFGNKYRQRADIKENLKAKIKKTLNVVKLAKNTANSVKAKVAKLKGGKVEDVDRPWTEFPDEAEYAPSEGSSETDIESDSDDDWDREASKLKEKQQIRKEATVDSSTLSRLSNQSPQSARSSVNFDFGTKNEQLDAHVDILAKKEVDAKVEKKIEHSGNAADNEKHVVKNADNQSVPNKKDQTDTQKKGQGIKKAEGQLENKVDNQPMPKKKNQKESQSTTQGLEKNEDKGKQAVNDDDPWGDSDSDQVAVNALSSKMASQSNTSRQEMEPLPGSRRSHCSDALDLMVATRVADENISNSSQNAGSNFESAQLDGTRQGSSSISQVVESRQRSSLSPLSGKPVLTTPTSKHGDSPQHVHSPATPREQSAKTSSTAQSSEVQPSPSENQRTPLLETTTLPPTSNPKHVGINDKKSPGRSPTDASVDGSVRVALPSPTTTSLDNSAVVTSKSRPKGVASTKPSSQHASKVSKKSTVQSQGSSSKHTGSKVAKKAPISDPWGSDSDDDDIKF